MARRPDSPTKPGNVALARKGKTFTPLVVQQLAGIEQELGGRAALVQTLALAPLTPDLSYLLGMLGDPKHATLALAEICARGNILPGEILRQIRNAALLKGQALAAQHIATHIPAVVQDVMKKAAPYEAPCHACLGMGSITPEPTAKVPNPSPGPCETCKGAGKLVYQPNLEQQKVAIDLAQLIPRGGGGGVNILQQFGANAGGPTGMGGQSPLEKLALISDRILYGSGAGLEEPILDADLVEPPEPPADDDPPAD